ncbi:MAG: acetyl-CoA carboxylase carboxyl transferase subunit alpha, partial [Candidatus Omnitrophica bacterium]|nr:acetyl-CoA carboxylase carboxyl transferase subunit alpha [Candidatus Omnitrophota bacterium]
VISPEGCAAILWKDVSKREVASKVLKLTAPDLLKFGLVEEIIPETEGGAHKNHQETAGNVKKAIIKNLEKISKASIEEILEKRYQRYRKIGVFTKTALSN